MTDAIKKAVAIMDESFLEWSRAKDKGDEEAMEIAHNKGAQAALTCGDPLEAFRLHKLNGEKLSLQRKVERALANSGIEGTVTVTMVADAEDDSNARE